MDNEKDPLDVLNDALLSPPLFGFPAEDSTGSISDSSRSSSQHSESPRNDWALPGWSQETKPLDDLSSFSMGWTSLDMDTEMASFIADEPPLSIDPNALFHFTFDPPNPALQQPTPNAGSASSRSTSPAPQDASAGVNPSDLNLFTELGRKARDAVGIMLAIPAGQLQAPPSPVSPVSVPSSKVPIPRLRPSNSTPGPLPLRPVPSVTSPTIVPTPPASQPASSPPAMPPKPVRPKTSHTTIERRYRTNLNARILALRRAVPALRILEKNTPSQTQGKGLTGATAPKWDFDDVINERGYVDGVRAAKKNSKGVVLGKAVEYIRALKRRETRLQRESDGLRALLSGLVGGPELLREWEREWRERFGGEEADEVDEDEGDLDADDDGAGEEDSDEDDARAKKRARTTAPQPAVEKRKRGRPRKHPAPAPLPSLPAVPVVATTPAALPPAPASKPLLALALIFSLFRPGPSPAATHTGAVLTPVATSAPVPDPGWSGLQILHTLVSALLLVSLVGAYLPRSITRLLPDVLIFAPPPPVPTPTVPKEDSSSPSSSSDLRAALGAKGGVFGALRAVLTQVLHLRLGGDLRGWRRIGDLDVVRAPLLSRIQTYFTLVSHARTPERTPADNITLALLAHAFAPARAAAHWADARKGSCSAAERLVLDMDVDEAAAVLAAATSSASPHTSTSSSSSSSSDSEDDSSPPSPTHIIATHLVLARAKTLAAHTFVAAVSGAPPSPPDADDNTSAAGRELGGEPSALTRLLTLVARAPPCDVPLPSESLSDTDSDDEEDDASAARALLRATLLFRRVFPNAGEKGKERGLDMALRRVLASPAFDANEGVEDARDLVVDMLRGK